MRIEQEHGWFTVDEWGKFHSFNDEPAIVIESYQDGDDWVNGYTAWYNHGELVRCERNIDGSNNNEG